MDSSLLDLIEELWLLKRDIVSDGFDRALYRLAEEVPMSIHEYPTGETCWTWLVPEKWTCRTAYLETLQGQRLIDYSDHPLHVVSYSLPFEGVVSRAELLDHLHTHPTLADALPYVFKYYERDWGLCASQSLRDSLTEESYRVVIRTEFEPGTLKVGEVVIPGQVNQCVMLVAHLCHPAMANDDLTGVAVGIEVARELLEGSLSGAMPYYTYRLLILPETIGSVAYLSHHEQLIPKMAAGLFLEMLGKQLSPRFTALVPPGQPGRSLPDFCAARSGPPGLFRSLPDGHRERREAVQRAGCARPYALPLPRGAARFPHSTLP